MSCVRADAYNFVKAKMEGNPCEEPSQEVWSFIRRSVVKQLNAPAMVEFKGAKVDDNLSDEERLLEAIFDTRKHNLKRCKMAKDTLTIDNLNTVNVFRCPSCGEELPDSIRVIKELCYDLVKDKDDYYTTYCDCCGQSIIFPILKKFEEEADA